VDPTIFVALTPASLAFIGAVGVFLYGKYLERKSTNIAVLAEIQRLLEVIKAHQEWWEDRVKAGNTNVPLIPFSTDVYQEQLKNIGLLDREFVARVVKFYGYLTFVNSLQASRPGHVKSVDFDSTYSWALKTLRKVYDPAFEAAFKKFNMDAP